MNIDWSIFWSISSFIEEIKQKDAIKVSIDINNKKDLFYLGILFSEEKQIIFENNLNLFLLSIEDSDRTITKETIKDKEYVLFNNNLSTFENSIIIANEIGSSEKIYINLDNSNDIMFYLGILFDLLYKSKDKTIKFFNKNIVDNQVKLIVNIIESLNKDLNEITKLNR